MNASLRRGFASAAVVATMSTAALAMAGAAQANPIVAAPCGANDVNVTVRYNDSGMGHSYWRVVFTSAGGTCVLRGVPTDLVFADDSGRALPIQQITGSPVNAEAVTVAPGRPASSLIRTRLEGERQPVAWLSFTLPSEARGARVTTEWPAPIAGPISVTEVRPGVE
ncbi:DUF4232 domain-containing protein [Allokutzneria oryzae]|uniref:DUF4232 domain-containing protein n=1 Tax=Allokutzneria oryzae TaxID=1378989 RepID=A0ABV5ZNY3_9PSEU